MSDVKKDDIDTLRIMFNADIEYLCNQGRLQDARELEEMKDRIIKALKEEPSADVEPVRHGKPKVVKRKQWVDDYKNLDGHLYEANSVLVEYEEEFCPFCGKALGDFNSYCGNCGAKMDGDKE